MTDYGERDSGTPRGTETAVPAGMMKMMERAGCRCAEMMAMCAGTDQDADAAEHTDAAATGQEEEADP